MYRYCLLKYSTVPEKRDYGLSEYQSILCSLQYQSKQNYLLFYQGTVFRKKYSLLPGYLDIVCSSTSVSRIQRLQRAPVLGCSESKGPSSTWVSWYCLFQYQWIRIHRILRAPVPGCSISKWPSSTWVSWYCLFLYKSIQDTIWYRVKISSVSWILSGLDSRIRISII